MTNQFKTFLWFSLLAGIIIFAIVIGDKFNIDLLEYAWVGIIIFLLLLWYKFLHKTKNNSYTETNTSPIKKLLSSWMIIDVIVVLPIILFIIFALTYSIYDEGLNNIINYFEGYNKTLSIFIISFLILFLGTIKWFIYLKKWTKIVDIKEKRKIFLITISLTLLIIISAFSMYLSFMFPFMQALKGLRF